MFVGSLVSGNSHYPTFQVKFLAIIMTEKSERYVMRLSSHYIDVIKKNFRLFFKQGDIFLFGSRVDDSKKGGDIDLYLAIDDHENLFEKKLKFLSRIKRELGDQKIDVVFNIDSSRLIEQEAKRWGIKL